MINEDFMIKKLQEKINTNQKMIKFIQWKIKNKELNIDNKTIKINISEIMVFAEFEIKILKQIIKQIQNKEFDESKIININKNII